VAALLSKYSFLGYRWFRFRGSDFILISVAGAADVDSVLDTGVQDSPPAANRGLTVEVFDMVLFSFLRPAV
jgi:hypothetical protein